jgi:rRNA processing protein Krr1/Pno1
MEGAAIWGRARMVGKGGDGGGMVKQRTGVDGSVAGATVKHVNTHNRVI